MADEAATPEALAKQRSTIRTLLLAGLTPDEAVAWVERLGRLDLGSADDGDE